MLTDFCSDLGVFKYMKIYLVGGAVRDKLLGLPVKERDWVVVGAQPADLLRLGYRQVGKDFPVFLHPKTGEEYALARTERKTAPGYKGFTVDASPDVTLTEDLLRRDLTINAIAEAPDGTLTDPFHGCRDLKARVLRHVSEAFAEDPVRILRVGRFAARFAGLGFTVAPQTTALMQQMVSAGEVDALQPERVWKEWERALKEAHPEAFFAVLETCGARSVLFPDKLMNGQPALQRAVETDEDAVIRFAALSHSLSRETLDNMCTRFRVPNEYSELAVLVVRFLAAYESVRQSDAEQIVTLLQSVDAFRRVTRFEKWLTACKACVPGDGRVVFLQSCLKAAQTVDAAALASGGKGSDIAARINQARIQAVADMLSRTPPVP